MSAPGRVRINYNDPENREKLTNAVNSLLENRDSGHSMDMRQTASHFGVPYNTLRDNYIKYVKTIPCDFGLNFLLYVFWYSFTCSELAEEL
jgi:hypothetical protein